MPRLLRCPQCRKTPIRAHDGEDTHSSLTPVRQNGRTASYERDLRRRRGGRSAVGQPPEPLTACMFSMCWKETKSGIAITTYNVRRSPAIQARASRSTRDRRYHPKQGCQLGEAEAHHFRTGAKREKKNDLPTKPIKIFNNTRISGGAISPCILEGPHEGSDSLAPAIYILTPFDARVRFVLIARAP